MQKMTFLALSVVLWLAVAVPTALALDIVYPADGTYVIRNDYLIIKGGEPAIDAFVLEVDGLKAPMLDISQPGYRQLMQDMVLLPADSPGAELFTESGRHKVTVEGYVRGQTEWRKVSVAEAEFYYHPDPAEPPPEGFEPFVMHVPQREALCSPCHDMNVDSVAMDLASAKDNPCVRCHKRMLNKRHVHGPAGAFQCGSCHLAGVSGGQKFAVTGSDSDICNGCHQDKQVEFEQNKFVHGPVGAGLCLLCHDAHASDQEAQVLMPVNDLCLGCHDTIAKGTHVVKGVGGEGHPLKDVPNPADPSRDLSCASCHDPHGGASRSLFVGGYKGRFSLCQYCHQK